MTAPAPDRGMVERDHVGDVTDMVERVARAMATADGINPDEPFCPPGCHVSQTAWQLRLLAARAGIAAMREPTQFMFVDGGLAFENAAFGEGKLVFEAAADCWRAMVDAALSAPGDER